jgi:hypothetical protein
MMYWILLYGSDGGGSGQWRWWSPEVEMAGDVTATKKSKRERVNTE